MSHLLDDFVRVHKSGELRGLPSICSAHPWVLKLAVQGAGPVLIESTCNQVNQFGGYSGMTPADFITSVSKIAAQNEFPKEKLLMGGDHLGPFPWKEEPAASAMVKAAGLVRSYVHAGFTKIHLDASMSLGDDPPGSLDLDISARRTVELAQIAEESIPDLNASPRYIIGTEVPMPGGAQQKQGVVHVTTVEDAQATLEVMQSAFVKAKLQSAWERVRAMVVQPGVEFGDGYVLDYIPEAAGELAAFSEKLPLIFEAHSTDYQRRESLWNLVRDHFAILKVGPALTFTYREAVFALAMMESELFAAGDRSELVTVLDQVMLTHPKHWEGHYRGTPSQQAFSRKYSLSDRARYYWADPVVQAALRKLFSNLAGVTIPLSLMSQYAPLACAQIRAGGMLNCAASVIDASIKDVLNDYQEACNPDSIIT